MTPVPDFLELNIDVNTLAMHLSKMTQKKAVDTVDKLIESGDVAAMISRYVDLTMQATKLRDHLMADPAIAAAISGLMPKAPQQADLTPWVGGLRGGMQAMMPMASDDNPLGATVPTPQIPGTQEPMGTIHKDVPISYEYPMDEYAQSSTTSKDKVMQALSKFSPTSGYQGIDPQGEVV